ncbi:MAG: NifU family protein [Spongiibacteraceae bacterium]
MQAKEVNADTATKIDDLTAQLANWKAEHRDIALELVAAVESFHTQALKNLTAALNAEPESRTVLRQAISDPLVYAMLRRHQILKPSLDEQVLNVLALVRPDLQQHSGDVELVSVDAPDTVTIRLTGACDGCGSADITLEKGVKKALLEHCSWIRDIIVANHAAASDVQTLQIISPFEAEQRS